MARHPERSASAHSRRCAQSKDACAPMPSCPYRAARRIPVAHAMKMRQSATTCACRRTDSRGHAAGILRSPATRATAEALWGSLLRNQAASPDAGANTLKVGPNTFDPRRACAGQPLRCSPAAPMPSRDDTSHTQFQVALSPEGGPELRVSCGRRTHGLSSYEERKNEAALAASLLL